MKRLLSVWIAAMPCAYAQLLNPSFVERFDTVSVPHLPSGWSTTTNRSVAGDFVTSASSPHSVPGTLLSTNATIPQSLTSPLLTFANATPTRLEFYTSRSGSHTAGLLVEASFDNGMTFPLTLTDTLRNPGTSGYVLTSVPLPATFADQRSIRFRWRLIGIPSGGTTGTFRLDDVTVTTVASFDLALSALRSVLSDSSLLPGRSVPLQGVVKNAGTREAALFVVHFFRDGNANQMPDPAEELSSVMATSLLPGDSTVLEASSGPLIAGENRYIALIEWSSDSDPGNDTAATAIVVGAEPQTLIINEVMFDPLPGQGEWVELYHRGREDMDIARWKLTDRPAQSGVNSFILTSASAIVRPRDYVVIAADSTIFTQFPYLVNINPSTHVFVLNRTGGLGMNNDGDDVILCDVIGETVDSVSYAAAWHHPDVSITKGRSLERINPDLSSNDSRNWSSSPSLRGGTPGLPNGIFTTTLPSSASISVRPNPFSPDGDGFDDFCIVHYNLPMSTSVIRISIFDVKGRLIRRLARAELSGCKGDIVWDGLDEAKERARVGMYIVFIEAVDGQAGVLATAKAVVVVAMRL